MLPQAHTDRQTDKHTDTDKQTHRHRQTNTQTQTNKHRDKHTHTHQSMCFALTGLSLHRRAYQHKTCNIIEHMIVEAMLIANDHIRLPGTDGRRVRISDAIHDMVRQCFVWRRDGSCGVEVVSVPASGCVCPSFLIRAQTQADTTAVRTAALPVQLFSRLLVSYPLPLSPPLLVPCFGCRKHTRT